MYIKEIGNYKLTTIQVLLVPLQIIEFIMNDLNVKFVLYYYWGFDRHLIFTSHLYTSSKHMINIGVYRNPRLSIEMIWIPDINIFESIFISYDLQRTALVLVIIGFIAMIMRLGILNKYKLKIHDLIFTLAYLLVILSLSPMINSAYFVIIFHIISFLILIHGLIGIVFLVMGFVFVINKGNLKIKREWKNSWSFVVYKLYIRHLFSSWFVQSLGLLLT